ncbi:hypothetical protein EDB89DRAFT_1983170 [Lactarius sanguifluus]|nr:hypothetical protein EDB89DRAFT_1983170 [Lactarius sanguifluus]
MNLVHVPTPRSGSRCAPETRCNAMSIPAEAVSIPRDGPSSALGASVTRVAHRRSACTSGNSETSSEVPPRQLEYLQPRTRIRPCVRTSNRATGCRPSYSVLAMRSVRRHSGWLEPSAAAGAGLLSSTARCSAALGGTTCAAGGTPTKWGSTRWVIRALAGTARKSSKSV